MIKRRRTSPGHCCSLPNGAGPMEPESNTYEDQQGMLDPHRAEEQARARVEVEDRLRRRHVHLTGRERDEELADLLDAIERFEAAVEARGGDPMVDWIGTHEPDDTHFVPPQRAAGESVAAYLGRLDDATQAVRRHRPHQP